MDLYSSILYMDFLANTKYINDQTCIELSAGKDVVTITNDIQPSTVFPTSNIDLTHGYQS